VLAVYALAVAASGCAELGVVTDGSSISFGKPNGGYLIDGRKLPEKGDGYTTREVWEQRGNRYGTDELVSLVKGVAKRMRKKVKDVRLVVADLSSTSGGAAHAFHRSHQNGRDADLLYYMRDAEGKPFEADAMHVFNARGVATDGTGISVDIPRTWLLVKELLSADEAYVQYIFMYRPIVEKMLDYAVQNHEAPELIARAQKACKQPGDSAPHNDHMHVRVYCAANDRQFGCVDIGPLELLAEREAEQQKVMTAIAEALPKDTTPDPAATAVAEEVHPATAADVWAASSEATSAGTLSSTQAASFGALLRAR
jgi:penicillin-insensitive murein endopeptidase